MTKFTTSDHEEISDEMRRGELTAQQALDKLWGRMLEQLGRAVVKGYPDGFLKHWCEEIQA